MGDGWVLDLDVNQVFLWLKNLLVHMKNVFRHTPIIGGFVDVRFKSVKLAFFEFAVTTIASTVPIWFFPVVATFFFKGGPTIGEAVNASVKQGDLYLYSAAVVGPLLFAITQNYAQWNSKSPSINASRIGRLTFEFPHGSWFFAISLLITALAALLFGLIRFRDLGLIIAQLNQETLLSASIVVYVIGNICMFCVSVYRNELVDVAGDAGTDQTQFLQDWENRHG